MTVIGFRVCRSIGAMLSERPYLTLGGAETFLLFTQEFPLRDFCAFELFGDEDAFGAFEEGFLRPTADAAGRHDLGLMLDCLVWRASADWMRRLGYAAEDVRRVNVRAVERMRRFAETVSAPTLLVGDVGPRGDGYSVDPNAPADANQAEEYHRPQIAALAEAGADRISALTMTSAAEAIGIVRAAQAHDVPVFVSPTVETDGTLPDGSTLERFIRDVDAATDNGPAFYMVNCAHPTHLRPTLERAANESWTSRLRGFRANASTKSHEELDNSEELDAGDIPDLAQRVAALHETFNLEVIGGCCGTDARHLAAIAAAVVGH